MASSPELQTSNSTIPQTSLSEAEKLRRRRAARNKRILASGTDRLNRIVGLSSSQTGSSVRGEKDDSENSIFSKNKSSLDVSEKNPRSLSESIETSTLSSASTLNEILKSNSSATTVENHLFSTSAASSENKYHVFSDPIDEKSDQDCSNFTKDSSNQDLDSIKRMSSRAPPSASSRTHALSMDSSDHFLQEILKSANSSGALSRDSFGSEQPDPQEINEVLANVLPSFLAQHASEAVLSSNPTLLNSSGVSNPETIRTKDSVLSLDSGIGRFFRIFFFTFLVLFLLYLSFSPSGDTDIISTSDFQQGGYILSLPLFGDLKPIHILLAVEVLIQTHRYFQAQRVPPRRMGPNPLGLPGFLGKAYQLYIYYSDSWNSLTDDLCFGIFFLGIGTLIFSLFYD